MKKILAVFLLLILASICSAQVEHGGLRIPGDGAVQIQSGKKVINYMDGMITDGLIAYYARPEDTYKLNVDGDATWEDHSEFGQDAYQNISAYKPTGPVLINGVKQLNCVQKYLIASHASHLSISSFTAIAEFSLERTGITESCIFSKSYQHDDAQGLTNYGLVSGSNPAVGFFISSYGYYGFNFTRATDTVYIASVTGQNGGGGTLYVNGTSISTGAIQRAITMTPANTTNLFIGGWADKASFLYLRSFVLFNRILSRAEQAQVESKLLSLR